MPLTGIKDRTALFAAVSEYISRHYEEAPDKFFVTQCCRPMAAPRMVMDECSLEERLRKTDAGFSETLLKLIDQTGKKDSAIYNKANISRQHFSKIRNNLSYKPTKPTAVALAIALELDMDQTADLLKRAGYALSDSSKFDVIIKYFIEQKHYDITDINMTLYEFDQPLLTDKNVT